MGELQALSFIFIFNFRLYPLFLKLVTFVPNVLNSCILCPLAITQLDFSITSGHVTCT
ncbi:hypothetical protein Hanom_Chr02g00150151 [Helianthus anomalus]